MVHRRTDADRVDPRVADHLADRGQDLVFVPDIPVGEEDDHAKPVRIDRTRERRLHRRKHFGASRALLPAQPFQGGLDGALVVRERIFRKDFVVPSETDQVERVTPAERVQRLRGEPLRGFDRDAAHAPRGVQNERDLFRHRFVFRHVALRLDEKREEPVGACAVSEQPDRGLLGRNAPTKQEVLVGNRVVVAQAHRGRTGGVQVHERLVARAFDSAERNSGRDRDRDLDVVSRTRSRSENRWRDFRHIGNRSAGDVARADDERERQPVDAALVDQRLDGAQPDRDRLSRFEIRN